MTDRQAAAGGGAGPRTILVVEDDRSTRQLLAMVLSEENLDFHMAATGHEAMEYAASSPPAMVLLDMHLPRLQGEAVATALRIQYGRSLPILAMSASNEAAAANRIGAFDFLSKPFDIDQLLSKVRHGLELAEQSRQLRHGSSRARDRLAVAAKQQRQSVERRRAARVSGDSALPA